jgi:cyanate permease
MKDAVKEPNNWVQVAAGTIAGLLLAFLPLVFPQGFLLLGLLAYLRQKPQSWIVLMPSIVLVLLAIGAAFWARRKSFVKGLLIAGSFAALFATAMFYVAARGQDAMRLTP